MFVRLLLSAILCCTSAAMAQEPDVDELPRPEFGGLNQKQITKRIFSKERDMISKLGSRRFLTEAYLQSLGHHQAKGLDVALDENSEGVIDDAYILARVDFGKEYGDTTFETVLFGERPWRSRYVLTNRETREQLFPEGFLAMFFPDLYDFNADVYSLIYKQKETLFSTDCLVFAVAPSSERASGKFSGEIWVDTSSYGIVRLRGVFTGPFAEHWYSSQRHYYHFDSWREKVGDGFWLPSAAYFDERRAYRTDGNLEFHFRGYALLWQQQKDKPDALPSSKSRNDGLESPSTPISQNGVIARLDADGLLATPGEEERRLDRMVHEIAPMREVGPHKIACRVLLTTPAEMFPAGDVIVVSRGLLNIVPNDSVLAFMLAHQVAHVILGHTSSIAPSASISLFDLENKKGFTGLGIRWTPDEELAAHSKAIVLIKGTPYKSAVADTAGFLSQLGSESHRFPNLVRARFGVGVISEAPHASQKLAATAALRFENRFHVSLNRVVGPDKEPEQPESKAASSTSPSIQVR
jgi:hypothetical protein